MTDNIVNLNGAPVSSKTPAAEASMPGPKDYLFYLKEGGVVPTTGYLAVNGQFAVTLDTPNDALTINFYVDNSNLLYVVEDDEVQGDET